MKNLDFFKTLTDTTRARILHLLKDGELCVCKITSILKMPQSSLSHHLTLMRKSKIISVRKQGKWHYYSLNKSLGKKKAKIISYFLKMTEKEEVLKNDRALKDKVTGCSI